MYCMSLVYVCSRLNLEDLRIYLAKIPIPISISLNFILFKSFLNTLISVSS